jgi:hypothetical protein
MSIRIIKHEAVSQTGSFEVKYSDGQPSRYFYFEDVPGRRLRSEQMTMVQAMEAAKAFARREAGQMKYADTHSYSDPEKAARKLLATRGGSEN